LAESDIDEFETVSELDNSTGRQNSLVNEERQEMVFVTEAI
jgi:hypothetical protein